MRVLITGAAGFVGNHLVNHLLNNQADIELHGTIVNANDKQPTKDAQYHVLDLRDFAATKSLIAKLQPDHIYHLAAQASVQRSFSAPWETLENNIKMQVSLLEAMRQEARSAKMVIVSSGEIYGTDLIALPPTEESPFRPTSPYSVSKVAQDMLGLQYAISENLYIMRARPFNHLGTGQAQGFVTPDFAMQIAEIEAQKRSPVINVGSLSAERDFTDVRDVVRAYHLIMLHGEAGQAYNVASGKTYPIQYLLDTLIKFSQVEIEVRNDPSRNRPSAPKSCGDASLLRKITGWEPKFPIEQTLLDVLNEWRSRVAG